MTNTSKVLKYLEQAAARAEAGDDADPPSEAETINYTRNRLSEAIQFAHAGADIPPGARLKPVKSAILAGLRPVTSNQGEFNRQLLAAVDGLVGAVERIGREIPRQEQRMVRIQAGIATTDLTIDDLATEVHRLSTTVRELIETMQQRELADQAAQVEQTTRIEKIEERQAAVMPLADDIASLAGVVASLAGDQASLSAKQDLIFRVAREAFPDEAHPAQLRELSRELDTGYEELYQDLEDTFRGTREHVRALTAEYLDDVATVPGKGAVVDVGCGRGEWLEVLRDADIQSYGVDTNQVVVDRCVARGLDARADDALVHLRQLPESSLRAVTSFHLVEHLSLDTLIGLIEAALLALKPGGILVLETPNPTNLNVGASSFYLDPTHIKPVHPQFLEFLLLARGFATAEVRFLHSEDTDRLEPQDLMSYEANPARARALVDKINWALAGPLDYAVIARKAEPAR